MDDSDTYAGVYWRYRIRALLEPVLSGTILRNKVSKEEEAAMARANREGGQQKLGALLLIRGHS